VFFLALVKKDSELNLLQHFFQVSEGRIICNHMPSNIGGNSGERLRKYRHERHVLRGPRLTDAVAICYFDSPNPGAG
jgi:hypothetical protein